MWWRCNESNTQKWVSNWTIQRFKRSPTKPHSRLHIVQMKAQKEDKKELEKVEHAWIAKREKKLRKGKYDYHKQHRVGARKYTKYPVHDRAYRSIYKAINPIKQGRRKFRTTFRSIELDREERKKRKMQVKE